MRNQYGAFNKAVQSLYGEPSLAHLTLADSSSGIPEFDENLFREVAQMIYNAGGFDISQLSDARSISLIRETMRILGSTIDARLPEEVPETVRYALENNTFIFSGFKTFHAMREVGISMVTDKGTIKPYNDFLNDVQQIHQFYNWNYLHAEYYHALGSVQMAAKWQQIEKDGDKYNLQYRTAADSHVRETHRLLEGTTLPPSDPFWDKYYPPNGWGCRCNAVQVKKDKYQLSDADLAMKRGDNATVHERQKIFRYNAGKTLQLFPPKHPYYKVPADAKPVIQEIAKDASLGYTPTPFTAKSIPEAEELFRTQLGVTCSLKGFKKKDIEQVEDIFKCVDCHFKLYPELKEKIKFVGTSQGRTELYEEACYADLKSTYPFFNENTLRKAAKKAARKACSAGSDTYAYSAPSTRFDLNGLAFNSTYSGQKVKDCLESDVKEKWHPIACDTVKSVFDHELGHKIDELLGLHTDSEFLAIFNDAESKGADYIKQNLSQYAYNPASFKKPNYTASKEFIAEAWSEFLNNPQPRPIATAIGLMIKKKYEENAKKK